MTPRQQIKSLSVTSDPITARLSQEMNLLLDNDHITNACTYCHVFLDCIQSRRKPVWGLGVTNFIRSYLHQIFDDSHGLKASLKPLRRPFDRCQSRLEAINIGRDIKQINW